MIAIETVDATLDKFTKLNNFEKCRIDKPLSQEEMHILLTRITMQNTVSVYSDPAKQVMAFCDIKELTIVDDVILDLIDEEDNLEIYDIRTFTQSYANAMFFKNSDYDVVTLLTKPFYRLYDRDLGITKKIIDKAKLSIALEETLFYDIGNHEIQETRTEKRKRFDIRNKYVSPLRNAEGEITHIISTNRSTPIV